MANEKHATLTTYKMWLEQSSLHLSSAVVVWCVSILALKSKFWKCGLQWNEKEFSNSELKLTHLLQSLPHKSHSTGSLKFPSIVISSCGNSYPIKVLHQFFPSFYQNCTLTARFKSGNLSELRWYAKNPDLSHFYSLKVPLLLSVFKAGKKVKTLVLRHN